MTKVMLIIPLLLISQVLQAQPEAEGPPLKKIKILSWNIYMLPHLVATHSSKKERAKGIGNLLKASDYDVIVFQEAFHPLARKKIFQLLSKNFPYQAGPANRKLFSLKTNSGIWVFSKHPIVSHQSIIYKNRSGVDALSRKGGLLVEIDAQGQHIQIAGTHLQNSGKVWLRHAQCVEFYERLLKPAMREGVPQIICGDFNIDRNTARESYQFMLQSLDAEDGSINSKNQFSYDRLNNDLQVEKGTRQDLIDYILFRQNGGQANCINTIKVLKRKWRDNHEDLSDHYPLEAEVYFSNSLEIQSVASVK